MNRTEFVELHPELFHMAAGGAWSSIRRLGLLSTTAILDLAGIDGERRVGLEQQRRAKSVTLSIDSIDFVLRDQKPLSEEKLEQCLTDMTVGERLRMLNGKVFLWPTRQRCEELLNARAFRGFQHTIVEIDTAALLERYDVLLSPINSGATLFNPGPRGSTTFTSIEDFPFDRYSKRGRVRAVAEVSVDYAIPDVAGLTTGLWRAQQDRWVPADPRA
ncbi:MAG: hypothetical protein V3U83_07170 [Acidobacteriota bacterium]